MTDADLLRLVIQLQRHEGLRLKPYRDPVGKLTIGYGRNLDDRGITEDEADALLGNDIDVARVELARTLPWFSDLDSVRQAALVNMAFNMGTLRLLTFVRALHAMAAGEYAKAAAEFLDSRWAHQVGYRAIEVCGMIRTGAWAA